MADHVSVMLDECLSLLGPAIESAIAQRGEAVVVDATLGLGGHSRALLQKFPQLRIIAIDRDTAAIAIAQANLSEFSDRITVTHAVFDQISSVVRATGRSEVCGILFDLGVSSMQLDEKNRGFAYSHSAPLDMRMDASKGITAGEIINTYSREELVAILRNFGEEKFAPRIVDAIIERRSKSQLTDTIELAEIVKKAIPAATRRTGGNPAKRTFQALRIAVNGELDAITSAIPQALELLAISGRLVVMSFQSLEDKIVKEFFALATASGTPRELPVEIPELAAKFALVIRGSKSASNEEQASNPRSTSVKLRAIERVAA
jgi:16S rRNA (cytosine1402-N4)-methyltransferase